MKLSCFSLFLLDLIILSGAVQKLPSIPASEANASAVLKDPRNWWIQLGETVYHKPQGLSFVVHEDHVTQDAQHSLNISNYYYAVGAKDAIPKDLVPSLVASEGRYHVFHLPEGGKERMEQGKVGPSRAKSISQLFKVEPYMKHRRIFPGYTLGERHYVNPIAAYQRLEQRVVDQVTSTNLMGYLNSLVNIGNGNIISRAFDDPVATQAAVAYLTSTLQHMGSSYYQICSHNFGAGGVNVLAFLQGATSDAVIVGAHYDSRPFKSENQPAPGAVDNGSGTAGVLAIANAFASNAVKPQKSVYFVLFGGEEQGMLGSAAFVSSLQAGNLPANCQPQASLMDRSRLLRLESEGASGAGLRNPTRARGASRLQPTPNYQAIIMDEVAWRTPDTTDYPMPTVNLECYDEDTDVMDQLYEASLQYNTGANALNVLHSSHPFGSDHMSFLGNNIHASLTIHGDDEAYETVGYHSSKDTIDKVDPNLMASIVRMNAAGCLRLAGVAEA